MTTFAGVGCRNVIRRFAWGYAAVMTSNTGAAYHAVVYPGR